jgi:hypothetical protein
MDDAACRKTNRATTGESTAVTTTRIADRGFGLILAAGTSRDTLRRIRLLRPSTTARRLTQFRTAYVSRTQDLVRPDCWRTANSFGGSLVTHSQLGAPEPRRHRPNAAGFSFQWCAANFFGRSSPVPAPASEPEYHEQQRHRSHQVHVAGREHRDGEPHCPRCVAARADGRPPGGLPSHVWLNVPFRFPSCAKWHPEATSWRTCSCVR